MLKINEIMQHRTKIYVGSLILIFVLATAAVVSLLLPRERVEADEAPFASFQPFEQFEFLYPLSEASFASFQPLYQVNQPVVVDLGADRTVDETDADVAHEFTISYANGATITTPTVFTVWAMSQGIPPLTAVNVTIPAMVNSATYAITVPGDDFNEGDRTYTVEIAQCTQNGNNCDGTQVMTTDTLTLTVREDDGPPSLSISPADTAITEKEGQSVTFTLTNSENAQGKLIVPVTVAGITASTDDFTVTGLTNGNLEIANGDTTGSFTITLVDDNPLEGLETLTVEFGDVVAEAGNPKPAFTPQTYTITIEDTDTATVTASLVGSFLLNEGDSRDITISLDKPVSTDVEVRWTLTGGEDDWAPYSGTVTLPAGVTSTTARVTAIVDDILELNEGNPLSLGLVNPVARVSTQNPVGRFLFIPNADIATPSFKGDFTVVEQDADFKVNLELSLDKPVDASHTYRVIATETSSTNSPIPPVDVFVESLVLSKAFELTVPADKVVKGDREYTLGISSCTPSSLQSNLCDFVAYTVVTAKLTVMEDDDKTVINVLPSDLTPDVREGESLEFRVVSSTPVADTVSFSVVAQHVTTEAVDYALSGLSGGVLTIAKGATVATFTLSATQDDIVEPNGEELTLVINNLQTAISPAPIFSNTTYTVNIIDDGDSATVTASRVGISLMREGDSRGITISLDKPVYTDVVVRWTITGGEDDLAPYSGTVTLPAGVTSTTAQVTAINDDILELAENFPLSLALVNTVARVSTQNPVGTFFNIVDTDGTVLRFKSDVTVVEQDADFKVNLELSLDHPVDDSHTYTITTTETSSTNSPIEPVDVVFESLVLSKAFELTVPADDVVKGDREYTLSISSCTGTLCAAVYIGDTVKLTVMEDDIAPVTMAVVINVLPSDLTPDVREGESLEFRVVSSMPVTESVSFSVVTQDITTEAVDYAIAGLSSGTLAIAKGATVATFTLSATQDDIVEPNGEELTLVINNLQTAISPTPIFSNTTYTVKIIDDGDSATVSAVSAITLTEGTSGNVAVKLNKQVDEDVTLQWTITGTDPSSDFDAVSGQVTLTKLSTSEVQIPLQTKQNSIVQADRKYGLTLVINPAVLGVGVTPPSAEFITVADDDMPVVINVLPSDLTPDVREGESLEFRVVSSMPVTESVSFSVVTQDITTEAVDYAIAGLSSGTLAIAKGATVATFTLSATQDDIVEPNGEELTLVINNLQTAISPTPIFSNTTYTVKIIDDGDSATVSAVSAITLTEGTSGNVAVKLNKQVDEDVTLQWTITGTDPSSDFDAVSGQVTLTKLSTSEVQIPLQTKQNSVVQADRKYGLTLVVNPAVLGVGVTPPSAEFITVADDDMPVVINVLPSDLTPEVREDESLEFRVVSSMPVTESVSFSVVTQDITTEAVDYAIAGLSSGTLAIAKGATVATFTLSATQDDIVEPNGEELTLVINNLQTAISPTPIFSNTTYTVKIIDDGDSATVSALSAITLTEGTSGNVAVKLNKQVDEDVTLQWTITGTDPSSDFDAVSGQVTLTKLSTSEVQIPLQTKQNSVVQADRKYGLTLVVNPAVLGVGVTPPAAEFITVTDGDSATVTALSAITLTEGTSGNVAVKLNKQVDEDVTLQWTITGTDPSNDFDAVSGQVTLTKLSTSEVQIPLQTKQNSVVQADRKYGLTLVVNPAVLGVGVTPPSAEFITVTDDDSATVTALSAITLTEGTSGNVSVKLDKQVDQDVTLQWTITGTDPSSDFDAVSGQVTLTKLSTSEVQILLQTKQNSVVQADRKYGLTLVVNPAVLGVGVTPPAAEFITVTDDDSATVTALSAITLTEGTSGNVAVKLDKQVDQDVTLQWTITGTDPSSDFDAVSGQVTLTKLSTSEVQIPLQTKQNSVVQADRKYGLTLVVNPAVLGVGVTPPSAEFITVTDDDHPVSFGADQDTTETDVDSTVSITLSYPQGVSFNSDITYTLTFTETTNSGIAIAPVSLTIANGAESGSANATVTGDEIVHLDRVYTVSVTACADGGVGHCARIVRTDTLELTVKEDDQLSIAFVGDTTITEGDPLPSLKVEVKEASPSSDITIPYIVSVLSGGAVTPQEISRDEITVTSAGCTSLPCSVDVTFSANTLDTTDDDIVEIFEDKLIVSLNSKDVSIQLNHEFTKTEAAIVVKDNDKATLSIADIPPINEGATADIQISLDKALPVAITVTVSVNNSPLVTSITPENFIIPSSSTTAVNVQLVIRDNDVVERSKMFNVYLTAATSANVDLSNILTIVELAQVVTVTDTADTVQASVSLLNPPAGSSYNEGTTVRLRIAYDSGTVDEDITFSIAEGTNVEPAGTTTRQLVYSHNREVVLPKGQSSVDFQVTSSRDDIVNRNLRTDYWLTISCSNDLCGSRVISSGTAAMFSVSDDDMASLTLDAQIRSVAEGAQIAPSLVLDKISEQDVIVEFSTLSQGDTSELADKTVGGSSLNTVRVTIPAGSVRALIPIAAVDDDVVEGDETFNLSDFRVVTGDRVLNTISRSPQMFTITDNDVADITVARVGSGSVAEGGSVSFRFAISKAVEQGVSLSWSIADPNGDISDPKSGTVQFAALDTAAKVVDITVADDVIVEAQETLTFQATAPSPAVPRVSLTGTTAYQIVVPNTDKATIELASTTSTAAEGGSISYTLRYANSVTVDASVSYKVTVTGVSANADVNNITIPTVSIPSGSNSVIITLNVSDDSVVVGNRKYSVSIEKDCGSGQNINALCRDHVSGTPSTEFTVAEDDTAPTVTSTSSNSGVKFTSRPTEVEVEVSEPASPEVEPDSTIQDSVLVQFSGSDSADIKSLKAEDVSGESAVPSAPSRVNFVSSYDLAPVDTSNAEISEVDATVCLPLNGAFRSDRIFAVYHSADSVSWDRLRSSISAERTHVCADTEEFSYFALGYIQLSEDEEDRLLPPTGGILPNIGLLLLLSIVGFALLLMGGLYVSLRLRSATDNITKQRV